MREEQCRLGGDGLLLTDTALEAALRRTRVQTVAAPAAAGAATSSDTLANAPATDERHRRAWGKLVLSVCNETAQANVTQRLPLAPPGVPPSSPPAALLAHRQARAQKIALDKLKKFGTTSGRVEGVPWHEEGHSAIAKDDIDDIVIDDIAELDGLVRSSLRSHEDEIQVQLSDELLRRMVREVVEEHQRIAERRRA